MKIYISDSRGIRPHLTEEKFLAIVRKALEIKGFTPIPDLEIELVREYRLYEPTDKSLLNTTNHVIVSSNKSDCFYKNTISTNCRSYDDSPRNKRIPDITNINLSGDFIDATCTLESTKTELVRLSEDKPFFIVYGAGYRNQPEPEGDEWLMPRLNEMLYNGEFIIGDHPSPFVMVDPYAITVGLNPSNTLYVNPHDYNEHQAEGFSTICTWHRFSTVRDSINENLRSKLLDYFKPYIRSRSECLKDEAPVKRLPEGKSFYVVYDDSLTTVTPGYIKQYLPYRLGLQIDRNFSALMRDNDPFCLVVSTDNLYDSRPDNTIFLISDAQESPVPARYSKVHIGRTANDDDFIADDFINRVKEHWDNLLTFKPADLRGSSNEQHSAQDIKPNRRTSMFTETTKPVPEFTLNFCKRLSGGEDTINTLYAISVDLINGPKEESLLNVQKLLQPSNDYSVKEVILDTETPDEIIAYFVRRGLDVTIIHGNVEPYNLFSTGINVSMSLNDSADMPVSFTVSTQDTEPFTFNSNIKEIADLSKLFIVTLHARIEEVFRKRLLVDPAATIDNIGYAKVNTGLTIELPELVTAWLTLAERGAKFI